MYPILNLRYHKMDLHWYLRSLEEVVIRVLSSTFSIKASRVEGLTGVWVGMLLFSSNRLQLQAGHNALTFRTTRSYHHWLEFSEYEKAFFLSFVSNFPLLVSGLASSQDISCVYSQVIRRLLPSEFVFLGG